MCWPIKINGSIDCFNLAKRELRPNRMFYLFNLQTKVILDDEKTIKQLTFLSCILLLFGASIEY